MTSFEIHYLEITTLCGNCSFTSSIFTLHCYPSGITKFHDRIQVIRCLSYLFQSPASSEWDLLEEVSMADLVIEFLRRTEHFLPCLGTVRAFVRTLGMLDWKLAIISLSLSEHLLGRSHPVICLLV